MRVLVTGATGFIGSHLADQLIEAGHEVRALVRETSDTSHLDALGVECVVGSLHDEASLDEALSSGPGGGVDAVVHAAGGGKVRNTAEFYEGNTRTTENLLMAAQRRHRQRPLSRFVLISSLSAHGPSPDGSPETPDRAPHPVSHYGKSKLGAEKLALDASATLPVTILRPPAVYGPRDTRWATLFKGVRRRGLMPLPGRGHTTSLVYGPDVARAIHLALERPHPSGRVYFVEEGPVYRWEEVAASISEALGRRARPLRVPKPILGLMSRVAELWGRLRNRPVVLTRDKVADIRQRHWVCSAQTLRDELGWAPTTQFTQGGAAATAQWYLSEGWL